MHPLKAMQMRDLQTVPLRFALHILGMNISNLVNKLSGKLFRCSAAHFFLWLPVCRGAFFSDS